MYRLLQHFHYLRIFLIINLLKYKDAYPSTAGKSKN